MISHQEIRRFAREASRRLEGVRSGSVRMPSDQVFQELETLVEELQVSSEELRVQNEELLDLLGDLDGERFRSRSLFDLAPTPLVTTDRSGRLREANEAALRLLGIEKVFVRRKPLAVFVRGDDRRRFRGYLARVLRSGPGPEFAPGDVEVALTPRDGSEIPLRLAARPLTHTREGGDILWSLLDLRPVREREEARLRAERERVEREAAQDAVHRVLFLLSALTSLSRLPELRAVAERAAEIAAAEFGALAVLDVVEGDSVRRAASGPGAGAVAAWTPTLEDDGLLATLADTGSGLHERGAGNGPVRRHLMGSADADYPEGVAPRAVLVLPMIAPQGVIGSLTLVRGDEALLEPRLALLARGFAQVAALALEQALRLQSVARERARLDALSQERFHALTAVSHELRTPLQSILGYCDLLLQGMHGELRADARRAVEAARASARHQAQLVDGVLHLFRSENARDEARLERVVVQDVLREAATIVEELAHRKGLDLRVELPEAPIVGHLDGAKLRQVLVNLLGNAVKYTDAGHVRLAASCPSDRLVVEVEDTGDGIDPGDLARVFEPFWRSGGGRSGSGLGLAVTQRLVGLMGGEIRAESEPGHGSLFRVEVPLGRAPAAESAPAS